MFLCGKFVVELHKEFYKKLCKVKKIFLIINSDLNELKKMVEKSPSQFIFEFKQLFSKDINKWKIDEIYLALLSKLYLSDFSRESLLEKQLYKILTTAKRFGLRISIQEIERGNEKFLRTLKNFYPPLYHEIQNYREFREIALKDEEKEKLIVNRFLEIVKNEPEQLEKFCKKKVGGNWKEVYNEILKYLNLI